MRTRGLIFVFVAAMTAVFAWKAGMIDSVLSAANRPAAATPKKKKPATKPAATKPTTRKPPVVKPPVDPNAPVKPPTTKPKPVRKPDLPADELDEAVENAINKAIECLWRTQGTDGGWGTLASPMDNDDNDDAQTKPAKTTTAVSINPAKHQAQYPDGPTALVAYALLECGISHQNPRMLKALSFLERVRSEKTYCLGLRSQVWLSVNSKSQNKYYRNLETDSLQLVKSTAKGAYNYNSLGDGKSNGDNSNSQYGLLGAWGGALGGVEIPREYWELVRGHWEQSQFPDGGWSYNSNQKVNASTGTMTAAGLASLYVCVDNLDAAKYAEVGLNNGYRPIERGLEWLSDKFEAEGAAGGGGHQHYYLYGIERVGLAAGYKYFGTVDWYRSGASYLVRTQGKDGAFGNVVNTAFALLFLVRGRNAVIFNKLEYAGDWNNRPRDLATVTRWLFTKGEGSLNWQIVNLKVPVSDWHDAPILYIAGSKAPRFTEAEQDKIKEFILQGGTVLSLPEGRTATFDSAMKDLYKKLFPALELVPVPENHPLRTKRSWYDLGSQPRFQMISNGVRPFVIHIDPASDMPREWQLNKPATGKWAFEAAANIYRYVADKQRLRSRGVIHWPAEPDDSFKPSATVKLAVLKYSGNWNPEPLAHDRFALLMAKHHQVRVDIERELPVEKLAGSTAHLAVLTGTDELRLSEAQRKALKDYVEAGGTLFVDAAGGKAAFADSAQKVLEEIFGAMSLQDLPPGAPIWQLDGMKIDRVKYRNAENSMVKGVTSPAMLAVYVKNRPAVIYSAEDVTCGLLGCQAFGAVGYDVGSGRDLGSAFPVMRNIVMFAAKNKPAD